METGAKGPVTIYSRGGGFCGDHVVVKGNDKLSPTEIKGGLMKIDCLFTAIVRWGLYEYHRALRRV